MTRAIGLETSITVDFFEDILLSEDIFLFCSDGLHGLVSDDAIHAALTKTPSQLPKTAHHLIQLANDAGGRDNISVILAQAGEHTGNLGLDLNL